MLFLSRVRTRTGPLSEHPHRDTQFENLIRDRGVCAAKARLGRFYARVVGWACTDSHSEL